MVRRGKRVIGPIGHRAASASVGAARRPFDIQALEARVLLSAAAADVALPKGFVEIQWKGESRHAKAGEWILKLDDVEGKNNGQIRKIERLLGDANVDADVVRHLNADGVVLIRTAAGKKHAALSAALRKVAGFDFVEPNFAFKIAGAPNDSRYTETWSLNNTGQTGGTPDADIDAPEAWDVTSGEGGVVVGVIDTGVDYTHPDLAANIWINPGEIANDQIDNDGNGFVDDWRGWDFANDDNDPMDDNGHGTHVAGTIGAVGNNGQGISGVSWNAKLMPLKFTDNEGFGEAASAVAAINYVNMMALRGANVRVANNSWGGFEYSEALREAIALGVHANVLYVAAAGNDASDNDANLVYPAGYDLPNLITVAATDDGDRLLSLSNYGKKSVHVGAPGWNILSTTAGGGYGTATGTSYASPHVAGVAALAWGVMSAGFDFGADDIKSAIIQGGDLVSGLADVTSSGRRLNALGTLMRLPMRVVSVTPGAGQVVSTRPTEFVVRFSHPYAAATVQAGDLKVNGVSANSVVQSDAKTATFRFNASPAAAEGLHEIKMAAGSVTRAADGSPVLLHETSFRYDAAVLRVNSSTPVSGTTASLPFTQLDLNFSEVVDGGTVTVDDLVVSQGRVTKIEFVDGDTIRFTLDGVGREGPLRYELPAGAVADLTGGPSRAYAGQVQLDIADSFPLSLAAMRPTGHGVHGTRFTGFIAPVGDNDSFTLAIPAGRKLSFAVDAADGLAPRVTVRSSGGAFLGVTNAPVGTDLALQNIASPDGTYVVTVTGDAGTAGAYTLHVVSDSAVEVEDRGGARNDTRESAQNLDGVLRSLGGQVQGAAVAGRVDVPPGTLPRENEPNNSSGSANSGRLNFISKPQDRYQLAIEANLGSGADTDYYKLGRLHVGDVLTVTVSGAGSSRGTLGDPFVELYSGESNQPVRVLDNDDGGPLTDALIYRYEIRADDTYYVRARAYSMDAGSYDFTAYLEAPFVAPGTGGGVRNEQEPNDSIASATDLSSSWQQVRHVSTTTATLDAGDRDFYTYDFRRGDVIAVRIDADSQADTRLTLSGPNGAVVATEDGSSLGLRSGSAILGLVVPVTGRYHLEVSARSGVGAYTKTVEAFSATPPTAPADASDYYSLTLAAGELVSVAVADQGATHASLELYDAAGTVVARGSDGTAFDHAISQYRVQEPGRHYVRVTGDRNAEYELLVTRGAAYETGSNGSRETAQDLGDAHAVVGHVEEADYYRFDVNAGDTIELRTFTPETAGSNDVDPFLVLTGPNGQAIATDTNSATDGRNAVITHKALTAGTYTVTVGSQGGAGAYVLQVGGNVLSGLDGTEGSDTFYVRSGTGDELHVYRNADPAGPPTFVLSRGGTSRLRINGRGGDDLFIVDLSNGSPIPPGGAAFDGGPGADRLRLTGTTSSHAFNVSGTGVRFGSSQITYSTMGSVGLDSLPGDPVVDVGSLNITGAGRVALVQGARKVLKLGALNIADDGVLDLTDNSLVFGGDAASREARLADVLAWVRQARNGPGGRWTGNGITSSVATLNAVTGLAALLNPGLAQLGGQVLTPDDLIVKYGYNGDANLDGLINSDDYFRIDSAFLAQPANPAYNQGDFNYDGRINSDDYFLIDQAFLGQGPPIAAAAAASTVVPASSPSASAIVATPTSFSVEEPRKRARKVRSSSLFSTVPLRQTRPATPSRAT